MSLSDDTKDLLQSALGTPEARNEVVNAIDSSLKAGEPLTSDLDLNGFQINNLADPSSNQDSATKAYVDSISSGFANTSLSNLTVPINIPLNVPISSTNPLVIRTADIAFPNVGTSPILVIETGGADGEGVNAGEIRIKPGAQDNNSTRGAHLYLSGGDSNGAPYPGQGKVFITGELDVNSAPIRSSNPIDIKTYDVLSGTGTTNPSILSTGNANAAPGTSQNASGAVNITTGDIDDTVNKSGDINLTTGTNISGDTGKINLSGSRIDILGTTKIFSDTLILSTAKTPASASDSGVQGQIAWDSSFIYICISTNTWKRVAIATW